MSTINQLIKVRRHKNKRKPRSIALTRGFNNIKNHPVYYSSPFKRGVCTKVTTKTPKKPKLSYSKDCSCSIDKWVRSHRIHSRNGTQLARTLSGSFARR